MNEYESPFLPYPDTVPRSSNIDACFYGMPIKEIKETYPSIARKLSTDPHYKWTNAREAFARTGSMTMYYEMLSHVTPDNPPEVLKRGRKPICTNMWPGPSSMGDIAAIIAICLGTLIILLSLALS